MRALGLTLVVACACGGGEAEPRLGEFVGAFAGSADLGRVVARLPEADPHAREASGSYESPLEPAAVLRVYGNLVAQGGGAIPLAGTYSAEALYLWGEGYALSGYLEYDGESDGAVAGRYFSPRGPGLFTLQPPREAPVTVMCGGYARIDGTAAGTWVLAIGASGRASGSVVSRSNSGYAVQVTGRLSGTALELAAGYSGTPGLQATGVFHAATGAAQGTWSAGTRTGTWEASAAGCPAP